MHTSDADLRRILTENRSVAVLGAKSDAWEAAYYVPKYLSEQGWRVVGVNPKLAGTPWLGAPGVASLAELGPVEVIEVFRRSDALPAIAEEIVALPWRPRVVWFQLGIAHDGAATRLREAGIEVVQNRCMMPDHQRLVAGSGRS
ncbi:CoA-binding protein [Deltaproteobacteria bacterium]|nr:CoA-binding protein [Deltaproteobacteria bacterium]